MLGRLLAAMCLAVPMAGAAAVHTFSTAGPHGGWTKLAGDPATPGRVFATRPRLTYATTDGGRTWVPAPADVRGGLFAFDPGNRDRIYALGGWSLSTSADGGATWSIVGQIPIHYFQYGVGLSATVSRFAVSPLGGDIYVTDGELAYSGDGGKTFRGIGPRGPSQYVYDFALDRTNASTIFAATHDKGYVRSTDNGVSWLPGAGLPADYAGVRLAVADDRLYLVLGRRNAAAAVRYEYDRYVVYTSVDGGATWQPGGLAIDKTIAWTEIDLVTVPTRRGSVLLRAGGALATSSDGGATWSDVRLPGDGVAEAIAADARDLYASVVGYGIRRSSDGGVTWRRARDGLAAAPTSHAAALGSTILASTPSTFTPYPAALLRRGQDRNTWIASLLNPSAYYGGFGESGGTVFLGIKDGPYAFQGFVVDPGHDAVLAFANRTLLRSMDHGASFVRVEGSESGGGDRFAAANDGQTIYSCGAGAPSGAGFTWGSGGLGVSADGGKTWSDLPRPTSHFGCIAIAVASASPDIAYLSLNPEVGSGLLKTQDRGLTWRLVPDTGGDNFNALLVDPENAHRVIAGAPVVAIDTATGARETIGNPLPATRLALDTFTSPPTLYAGTSNGVYARSAMPGSGAWTRLAGSEGLAVNELALTLAPQAPTRRTLVAATSSGVHEFTIDTANGLVPVYRLFNGDTRSHLFTASAEERLAVLATLPQFSDEGIAFYAFADPSPLVVPVHRFYRAASGTHAYATTDSERDALLAQASADGVVYEGVAYYVLAPSIREPGTLAVHRFVDATRGGEVFTVDDDEREDIAHDLPQYDYRGIAFSAYPAAAGR
jgi:hypothetical protein